MTEVGTVVSTCLLRHKQRELRLTSLSSHHRRPLHPEHSAHWYTHPEWHTAYSWIPFSLSPERMRWREKDRKGKRERGWANAFPHNWKSMRSIKGSMSSLSFHVLHAAINMFEINHALCINKEKNIYSNTFFREN